MKREGASVVKAAGTNLAGVLEGKKQYQVPLYQRVCSWGQKQLDQLWNDIAELAAARRVEPSATHFIGSLVLAQSPDYSIVGVSKLLVVDGQQRLTTLTLLLAALRDHRIETGDPERADGIQAQYLVNVYDKGKPTKVLPTQADRAAYLSVVRSAPDAGGTDGVGEAYNHFRAKIAAADDPDDPHDLEEIENAVVSGLALVVVTAEAGSVRTWARRRSSIRTFTARSTVPCSRSAQPRRPTPRAPSICVTGMARNRKTAPLEALHYRCGELGSTVKPTVRPARVSTRP